MIGYIVAANKVCELEFVDCELYSIQPYVINFDHYLWQVGGFLQVLLNTQLMLLTATISQKYCWKWHEAIQKLCICIWFFYISKGEVCWLYITSFSTNVLYCIPFL